MIRAELDYFCRSYLSCCVLPNTNRRGLSLSHTEQDYELVVFFPTVDANDFMQLMLSLQSFKE